MVSSDVVHTSYHLLHFVEAATVGAREAKQAVAFPMNDLADALQ
jgi:hypothetical protein